MKRAAIERPRSVRVWREHRALSAQLDHSCNEFHPGHFRKGRRVGGCNSARCWLCHYSKLAGYPTLQEARSLLSFREQLAERSGGRGSREYPRTERD